MFAHGPQDLRSPGMSLNKDEEEIVQRVAAARTNRTSAGSAQTIPATVPAVVAPPSLASQLNVAQIAALAGLTGGMLTASAADRQLQSDPAQLMALAGLSQMGVDPSAIDMSQLATIGAALHGANKIVAPAVTSKAAGKPPLVQEPANTVVASNAVTVAPPQLSPKALELLAQSQGALIENEAKRARVG